MTTIYLEIDDEVTSIIDKLKKEHASDINLVIPKNGTILQSIVNLKILLSESKRLGKQVFIVTPDQNGKHLAARAGFPIKQEIRRDRLEQMNEHVVTENEGQNGAGEDPTESNDQLTLDTNKPSWIHERVKQRLKKAFSNDEEDDGTKKGKKAREREREKRLESGSKKRNRLRRNKVRLLPHASIKMLIFIFIPLVIVVGLVATLLLPTAAISITPKSEPITRTLEFSLRPDAVLPDTNRQIIPVKVLTAESELTRQFPATGEIAVGDKATGLAIFYNSFSSSSEAFPKGTKLQSEQGKVFLTISAISVPGAEVVAGEAVPGSATVQVEGEEVGEEFNIDKTKFIIQGLPASKKADVYAQTKTPIKGGASHLVKAVSEQDIAQARAQLEKELIEKVTQDARAKMDAGYTTGEGGIKTETIEVTTSIPVDGEGEQFDLKILIKATLFAFNEQEVQSIIQQKLVFDIPDKKHLVEQQGGISYTIRDANPAKQEATLATLVEKKLVWDIDTSSLREQLRGKSKEEAESLLKNLKTVQASTVSCWPFWVSNIPQFTKKIQIQLDNL